MSWLYRPLKVVSDAFDKATAFVITWLQEPVWVTLPDCMIDNSSAISAISSNLWLAMMRVSFSAMPLNVPLTSPLRSYQPGSSNNKISWSCKVKPGLLLILSRAQVSKRRSFDNQTQTNHFHSMSDTLFISCMANCLGICNFIPNKSFKELGLRILEDQSSTLNNVSQGCPRIIEKEVSHTNMSQIGS